MLNDLFARLLDISSIFVTPDWASLVRLIPALLLLPIAAFIAITGAKWIAVGPVRRGSGRRLPLAPDGSPVSVPVAGPFGVAVGVFLAAIGVAAGAPWLIAAGVVVASASLLALRADLGRPTAIALPRGRRLWVLGILFVLVVIVAATARVEPETGGARAPGPSAAAGAGQAAASAAANATSAPTAEPSLPPADAVLHAEGVAFVERALTAPAGRPFTVAFDNRDGVAHNLEIRDAGGSVRFLGDTVIGPTTIVYDVPSLPAGQYPFLCTVHPAMTGTLTVK